MMMGGKHNVMMRLYSRQIEFQLNGTARFPFHHVYSNVVGQLDSLVEKLDHRFQTHTASSEG